MIEKLVVKLPIKDLGKMDLVGKIDTNEVNLIKLLQDNYEDLELATEVADF
jgi:hypothetical protein